MKWGGLLYSPAYSAPWVVGLEANTTISGLDRYENNFKDEKVRNKEQYKTVDFSNFRMCLFRSLLTFSNLVL